MQHDYIEPNSQQVDEQFREQQEELVPHLRAYFSSLPEIRIAYYQPGPNQEFLPLSGPDRARVIICFARSVSKEHIDRRLTKISRHFETLTAGDAEFVNISQLDYRDACEVAFNSKVVLGTTEAVERDRLYRYNVFLEWNAGKKISGLKQDTPPVLKLSLDRSMRVLDVTRFITPIYRHLKLIDSHVRELRRLTYVGVDEFTKDNAAKSLAESFILKAIQSSIFITMSVMHRSMRLSARDYRDLFLLMPVYGMTDRERAGKLAKCAEVRDRLMFLYEEVTPIEVFDQSHDVCEAMQEFKTFMLSWLFEHYYGATGELIQTE
ncbi:MAG TPA: HepT-like ribonuclease domain-containing protein [Armatimonadota bacterium]|nr:HepT-like ribonuclease domain-containing protein [Armatimonadota bacterium]